MTVRTQSWIGRGLAAGLVGLQFTRAGSGTPVSVAVTTERVRRLRFTRAGPAR